MSYEQLPLLAKLAVNATGVLVLLYAVGFVDQFFEWLRKKREK